MSITSYRTFVNGLIGLTVSGVASAQNYDRIPEQVHTMPSKFPRLPQGSEAPMTAQGEGGWPRFRCDIVILVNPVHQNYDKPNYDLTITLTDNLCTALRAVQPNTICKSHLTWSIANQIYQLNDTSYWSIIATVMGNG